MRLLLINPRFEESFWSFRWALEEVLPGKRAVNPPLGLATLAALCPPHMVGFMAVGNRLTAVNQEAEVEVVLGPASCVEALAQALR